MSNDSKGLLENIPLDIPTLLNSQVIKEASIPSDTCKHNSSQAETEMQIKNGQFAAFQFRGPEIFINELYNYLYEKSKYYAPERKFYYENGVAEVTVYYPDMMELVKKFPVLKATGFWINPSGYKVCVVFSDTGNNSLSGIKVAGRADPRSDGGEWYSEHKATEAINDVSPDAVTGMPVIVDYSFPWTENWEKTDYIFEYKGIFYQMTGKGSLSECNTNLNDWVVSTTWENHGEILQYMGNDTEVHFPEQVGDLIITGICDRDVKAPINYRKITAVTIPPSYKKIGENAFRGCTKLRHVVLPSFASTLGSFSFMGCTSLESVVLPAQLTDVYSQGKQVFTGCSQLQDVYAQQKEELSVIQDWFEKCGDFILHAPEKSPAKDIFGKSRFLPLSQQDKQMFIDRAWRASTERRIRTSIPFKDLPKRGDEFILREKSDNCERRYIELCYSDGTNVGILGSGSDLIGICDVFAARVVSDFSPGGDCWWASLELIPVSDMGKTPSVRPSAQYSPVSKQQFSEKMFVLDNGISNHPELIEQITSRGGIIKDAVTQNISYLIVNSAIKEETKKRERANHFISKGKPIQMITYQQFFDMIMIK